MAETQSSAPQSKGSDAGWLMDIIHELTTSSEKVGTSQSKTPPVIVVNNSAPASGDKPATSAKAKKTATDTPTPDASAKDSGAQAKAPAAQPLEVLPLLAKAGLSDPLTLATQMVSSLAGTETNKPRDNTGNGMQDLMKLLGAPGAAGAEGGSGMGNMVKAISSLAALFA